MHADSLESNFAQGLDFSSIFDSQCMFVASDGSLIIRLKLIIHNSLFLGIIMM